MRRFLSVTALALMLPLVALAASAETAVLDVQKMTCGLCPVTVKKALENIPGVSDVKVDFKLKTATVGFDADKATTAALIKATTDAGYPSTLRQ